MCLLNLVQLWIALPLQPLNHCSLWLVLAAYLNRGPGAQGGLGAGSFFPRLQNTVIQIEAFTFDS